MLVRCMHHPTNRRVAEQLREMADLLRAQDANPWRARAYRRAADLIESLGEDVSRVSDEQGLPGLTDLPGIGPSIAAAVRDIVTTGRWEQLERTRRTADPSHLLQVVPGLGPGLASRIHDQLHVDTLEDLEIAAHDGRLGRVPGVGPRRAAMIRAELPTLLRNRPPPHRRAPDVGTILGVDQEYRERAAASDLPTIAPRRFNPEGAAWLPVLRTARGSWRFTVMFSNSERAHRLGKEHDWVIMAFERDGVPEARCTVVTESGGSLKGRRVVRGREEACRGHYRSEGRPVG